MPSKYKYFSEILEQEIKSGRYRAADILPGERTLAEQYSVSRVTIRAGIKLLVEKHLLMAIPGIGYQVLGDKPVIPRLHTHLVGGAFAGPNTDTPLLYVPYQLSHSSAQVLEPGGYNLVFANSDDDVLEERASLSQLLRHRIDGLLAMPAFTGGAWNAPVNDTGNYSFYLELYHAGLPVVLMDRPLAGEGVPGVYNDPVAIGAMQTEYMLKRGFRQVVFFDDSNDHLGALQFEGYRRTMEKAGLSPRQVRLSGFRKNHEWTTPGPRHDAELEKLLPLLTADTARLCSPFLVPALDRHFPGNRHGGFRIEWICVDFPPGWNGQHVQHYPCIQRPTAEIGRRAARKLLQLMRGEQPEHLVEWFPPVLLP